MLGRKPTEFLKVISRRDSLTIDDYKIEAAGKYPKLFKGLGVMKDSYSITHKEDAKTFQVSVPRKYLSHCIKKPKRSSNEYANDPCSTSWENLCENRP